MNPSVLNLKLRGRSCILVCLSVSFAAFAAIAHAAGNDKDPAETIRAFYKWYVTALDDSHKNKGLYDKQLRKYVTDRLIAQIDRLAKPDKAGYPSLNHDPFLNAQDWDPNWARNVSVHNLKINGERATMKVMLSGKMKSTVGLVLIRRHGGAWKIDNFIPKLSFLTISTGKRSQN